MQLRSRPCLECRPLNSPEIKRIAQCWKMETVRVFVHDESSATAIEYRLIANSIAFASIAAVESIGPHQHQVYFAKQIAEVG